MLLKEIGQCVIPDPRLAKAMLSQLSHFFIRFVSALLRKKQPSVKYLNGHSGNHSLSPTTRHIQAAGQGSYSTGDKREGSPFMALSKRTAASVRPACSNALPG